MSQPALHPGIIPRPDLARPPGASFIFYEVLPYQCCGCGQEVHGGHAGLYAGIEAAEAAWELSKKDPCFLCSSSSRTAGSL